MSFSPWGMSWTKGILLAMGLALGCPVVVVVRGMGTLGSATEPGVEHVCSWSDGSLGCWLVSRAMVPEVCAHVQQCGAEVKVQVYAEQPGLWGPGCTWSWR